MKINHMALFTKDLEKMKCFYELYFDAKSNQKYHNPKSGLETYFLSFDDGMRIEIMKKPQLNEIEMIVPCVGWAHLAFSVGSRENVDNITKKITGDGYALISAPRTTGDGYYESCIADPDGNQIEITE